jgi:hypothetical protein
MKKLLLLGVAAAAGYLVYRQVMASRAEDDLWSEATNAPDLTVPPVVEDVVELDGEGNS